MEGFRLATRPGIVGSAGDRQMQELERPLAVGKASIIPSSPTRTKQKPDSAEHWQVAKICGAAGQHKTSAKQESEPV